MAGLDDIISINITAATTAVAQTGFGTPLIATYTEAFPELTRSYSSLSGLISDGFATSDAAYMIAAKLLGQNPRVRSFKIGRRQTIFTQIIRLTPIALSDTIYSITIGGEEATFTSDSSATVAEICAGLTSAINGLTTAVTASNDTTHITVTSDTDGVIVTYEDYDFNILNLRNMTVEPGIADDLADILAYDSDWYGLLIDSESEDEIREAADFAQSNEKEFFCTVSDTECLSGIVTNDVMSELNDDTQSRTMAIFHPDIGSYAGAAWMGVGMPYQPGSITYAYKTLAGVSTVRLTDTQINVLRSKHGNYYILKGGVGITLEGWASGGRYMDITNGIDWLKARMQERIYSVLVNSKKIPYTDQGVGLVVAEVRAQLTEGINVNFLAADPAPTVTAPLVKDISPVDKANRLLPDIEFSATAAGAIHRIEITGTISL